MRRTYVDSSGHLSQLCLSGDRSQISSGGDHSQISLSGDYSQISSIGDYSKLSASGYSSVAVVAGTSGEVKGGANCAMALTMWVESEKRYRITVAYVGENGIKPDTWYRLDENGEFTEVATGEIK